ncbi:hypothetical protein FN846DRAFT_780587 [Sphaerosporella brunnea]|uniref:non-specific serine/threonine protein kinase n=1 Tax=Sphaerosporella brunnea TaxID=1250544 RepID=A0A5J5ESP3_9PEZI|nr:hypothetical protein FN846DRAFT_780587 [Sphaerosporella brunnea]
MSARRKPGMGSFSKGSMRPPPPPIASRLLTQHRSRKPQMQSATQPPPSSIAAFVQNYSKAGDGAARLPGKDAFQQLLDEMLSAEAEEDVATNCKVVEVVTTAGLSVLLEDDPFARDDDLLQKASTCLLVLKLIIERDPRVLFCKPPVETTEPEQTILYLWLLPRLMPLLGHPKFRSLAGGLLDTVQTMFEAVSNWPEHWKQLKAMAGFFRGCLNGESSPRPDRMCFSLRELSLIETGVNDALAGAYKLELPPPDYDVDAFIWKELPAFDPRSIRFKLTDVQHAALAGVHIFAALARIAFSPHTTPPIRSAADSFTSALQALAKIWSVLNIWESLPVMRESTSVVFSEILSALATALDRPAKDQLDGLYLLAARCIADTLKRPMDQMNQHAQHAASGILLSLMSISRESPLVRELFNDRVFLPALAILSNGELWKSLGHDMQVVILRLILDLTDSQHVVENAQAALHAINGGEWACKDSSLNGKLNAILPVEIDNDEGPRKRLKLDEPSTGEDLAKYLTKKIHSLFGTQEALDLDRLGQISPDRFSKLSEGDRRTAMKTLGLLSCAAAGDLAKTREGAEDIYRCSYCDSEAPIFRRTRRFANGSDIELLKTLETLHTLDQFNESSTIRALGAEALRRMTNHTKELTHLDLDRSKLGFWCMRLLQSRKRELRIAAGRALPSFMTFSHDSRLLEKNKHIVIDTLTLTSNSKEPYLQETGVLAWGQVGRQHRISVGQYLNVVLLKLVEYLGHPYDHVVGTAWNELDALVLAHESQPRKLFAPFWRTISTTVVKQMQSKPQILQTLLQFISMKLPEFLKMTQSFTLPYLVVSGQTELIQHIAHASRGPECSVQLICYDNIASILPVLLTQDQHNAEKYAMRRLESISSEFSASSLSELVRPDSLMIAAELLKMVGDTEEKDQRKRILHALRIVSKLSCKTDTQTQRKSKNIDYVVRFFESHVLGLCTLFSDELKNAQGKTTDTEKIRSLNAIQEMLALAANSVTSALPQICACSQSALESDTLRTTAIETWSKLAKYLGDEDLTSLLGQTFSILLRYWDVFDDAAKDIAQDMVAQLFTKRGDLIQRLAGMIPSMRSIPLLSKYENRLRKWRGDISAEERLHQLALRCSHENVIVVEYALVELRECIKENRKFVYTSAGNQKPHSVVAELIRCLLDVIVTFKDPDLPARPRIERLSAECLGLIGAVNPNIVESPRVKEEMAVLHNFTRAEESADFALFFLEKVLVKQFLSALDTKSQGFLAWCAQQLLEFCQKTNQINPEARRTQSMIKTPAQQRWDSLPPAARETLIPFLKSKYSLSGEVTRTPFEYPLFKPGITFREWLMTIITELLCKPSGENAKQIFDACVRICRGQDVSISKFLFPVAVLHIAISGSDTDRENITQEFLAVLRYSGSLSDSAKMKDTQRQCVETIFSAIDHMTKWLRDKRQSDVKSKTQAARHQNRHYSLEDDDGIDPGIRRVRSILDAIPPDIIGHRALEFKSYARSLLYWEQHIRHKRHSIQEDELESLYDRLQQIYTHIDEPDGMSGISAKLPTLDIDQQILEHRKAGKWTAVQSWYELNLAQKPDDVDAQANLIGSLRDSGQYDALLLQVDGMMSTSLDAHNRLLPFAVEASWVSGNWDALEKYLKKSNEHTDSTYDVRVGYALSELRRKNFEGFLKKVDSAREIVAHTMTESVTGSIRQCHHFLVQLHALSELQSVSEVLHEGDVDMTALNKTFESRLNLMGTYSVDKQYILSVRRAALQLSGREMSEEILSAWLSSAKLARKDDNLQQAYNAVHHATLLNPALATIEHAKLLWHEGQHKNAMRNLNGAIAKGILEIGTEAPPPGSKSANASLASDGRKVQPPKNLRVAKAKLLLARWLEASGQTHSQALLDKYIDASTWFHRWEKAYYYLGRHCNKLYEAEKAMHPLKRSEAFTTGEHARLIVQNYLRALAFGVKYIFQTMPRLLTVWLDLGDDVMKPLGSEFGSAEYRAHTKGKREANLSLLHGTVTKYHSFLGAWMFFTALPQLMSRIIHPHKDVYAHVQNIIVKVVLAYPQQSMWSLMAVTKSTSKDRAKRGQQILTQLKEKMPKKRTGGAGDVDGRLLINEARRLTDQLLELCNQEITSRVAHLSLRKDFRFRHELAPCQLVLPTQAVLTVTLPSPTDVVTNHAAYAFAARPPTIERFHDEVDIMLSLQRPRRIKIEASDGRTYAFLCKPKDDLRKDARLMEFNNMINRFFKRDAESSKRNLYIRTYSVTPLNEECGIIEWVNNVQTLREILLSNYKQKEITVNYAEVRAMLDEAAGELNRPNTKKPNIFTDKVLPRYPCVFHEWFLEMFSEPAAWFTARLAYTRTSAVMSMVGTVLGLGDRHGENILFDQQSGDTVHVDFNCLFDKGLGFEKPERVPFRLTHNMVDAFGVTGYEGAFRKACESAMRLLRHNEETMMTVLEAFIHDPSVDMLKKSSAVAKKTPKAPDLPKPPESPKEILESIQQKLRGLWESDTVPLSVEGHVEVLIKKATDPANLCAMYIGWCPMF